MGSQVPQFIPSAAVFAAGLRSSRIDIGSTETAEPAKVLHLLFSDGAKQRESITPDLSALKNGALYPKVIKNGCGETDLRLNNRSFCFHKATRPRRQWSGVAGLRAEMRILVNKGAYRTTYIAYIGRGCAGSSNRKVAPRPASLSAAISLPCRDRMRLAMASPKPEL